MITAWLHVERPTLTRPAPASHPLDFHKLSLFSSETGNITLASGQNPLLAVARQWSGIQRIGWQNGTSQQQRYRHYFCNPPSFLISKGPKNQHNSFD